MIKNLFVSIFFGACGIAGSLYLVCFVLDGGLKKTSIGYIPENQFLQTIWTEEERIERKINVVSQDGNTVLMNIYRSSEFPGDFFVINKEYYPHLKGKKVYVKYRTLKWGTVITKASIDPFK